jgi:hypothetical protein
LTQDELKFGIELWSRTAVYAFFSFNEDIFFLFKRRGKREEKKMIKMEKGWWCVFIGLSLSFKNKKKLRSLNKGYVVQANNRVSTAKNT